MIAILPRTAGRRRIGLLLLLLTGALLAGLSLAGCGGSSGGDGEVWVIGLDGADWDLLDPMIERGELPNLARLREEGAWGRLRSDEPMLSPVIWTSIATGKTPDEHGITWFMTDAPTGEKIPISSRNRWVRTIWNIATEHDRSSSVVGWWATWPVEPVEGFLVSDYVGWHSFGVTGQQVDAPGKVWPADIQSEVLAMLPSPDDVADDLLQTMVDLPADQLGFDQSRGPFGGPLPHLRQALATARGYTDIALDLLERRRTDFFAVYYEGTDAAMHLFTNYAPPKLDWVDDEDYRVFQNAISGYWQHQDQLLGELLARRAPDTTVIVVSDHGFRTGSERLREERFDIELADASHMIDGVVVIHGPNVKARTQLRGADIYDVAPTVLYLMDLPVARDMKGGVITSAFTEEFLAERPVLEIDSYDVGEWDRGDDIVIDPEAGENMKEMLRSLGYISGGEGDSSSQPSRRGEAGLTVEQAINFALVLRDQGRLTEAASKLREQLERHPDNYKVRLNLAQIYGEMNRYEIAFPIFEELYEEDPRDLIVIEDYALGLGRAGELERAVEIYRAGLEIDEEWAIGLAGLGFAEHQRGRNEEGLRRLRRAVELDPRLALGHYYLALVEREEGDLAGARAQLERTLELDPTHEQAALALSQIMQSRGEMVRAKTFLQDFLEKAGTSTVVSAEVAAIELREGKPENALPILREAVEERPEDVDLLGNLGVALAMTGEMDQAKQAFERILEIDPDAADAHAQLGNFYLQSGQVQQAEQHMERAAELAPENSQVQLSLATYYHRSGRLPEAMRIYEEVIDREPENALAIYQLAMATGASGDQEKAMELLEKARELDPSLPMPGRRGQGGQ